MNVATTALRAIGEVGSVAAVLLAAHAALNARLLRRPPRGDVIAERVSVLLPARDELATIGICLTSLLRSRDVPNLEILVLDDGSTDGTADAVGDLARTDPRLRLLHGRELPAGWLGKPFACQQLAEEAAGSALVFVDADVIVEPDGISRAVSALRTFELDLVSPYPRQSYRGGRSALVQPLLHWSWLTLVPLRLAERSSRASLAVANGQLLVCDATAYQAAGGHAAVRDAVIEDIALLRVFLAVGRHGGVVDGSDLASCRMYDSWPELVRGYTKSLWAAGGSRAGSAGQIAFLLLCFVAPVLGAAAGSWWCLAGYGASVVNRLVTDRVSKARSPRVLTLGQPISVLILCWLIVRSWRARRAGTITWKGRPL